jgi:hypothetical protein
MAARITGRLKSPLVLFVLLLFVVALFTVLGPAEKTLGSNVRVVYLHGAWVWAALAAFLAAGLVGLVGLLTRRVSLHYWSRALGRTGLFFWITYLPLSMWAMQSNWNGLFLAEPRWRLAIIFAGEPGLGFCPQPGIPDAPADFTADHRTGIASFLPGAEFRCLAHPALFRWFVAAYLAGGLAGCSLVVCDRRHSGLIY